MITKPDPAVDSAVGDLRAKGYAVASGRCGADLLRALRAEADRLVVPFAWGDRRPDFWCYESLSGDTLYRVHNLEKQPEAKRARELFEAGLLHELAAEMIGPVEATVCAMIVKTPRVAGVPWHRDRVNLPPTTGINLSVFLEDATVGNGCVEAVPGSHLLPDDADIAGVRTARPSIHLPVRAGDILVHDVRLMHASGDNAGGDLRRSIIVEFVAAQSGPR